MFLALVMCLGLLPVSAVAAEGGGVQAALNQILADYPNGSYFTANGKPCHGNPSNHNCYNCSLYGICETKEKSMPSGQLNAWTCKAFTAYVGNQVFGITNGRSAPNLVLVSGINRADKKESYDGIRVGDFVYYYSSTDSSLYNYKHTAVCMGTTNDTITLYEANSTSKQNQVGIVTYRTVKKTNMKSIHPYYNGIAIYRAANYDQVNGTVFIADGTYTLTPACAPNARLDVAGGSTEAGANIQIYTSNGTAAQQWQVKAVGNGYYTLTSKASGMVLDTYRNNPPSGQNVMQSIQYGYTSEQWKFQDAGDGYYYVIPRSNEGLCLDVYAANNSDGTNVQVYTANQSVAQKWKLTQIDQAVATEGHTHQGSFLWCEAAHPHYNYYKCSICGKLFTDNTTNYMSSCSSCNSGHWGDWSEWSTNPVTGTSTRQVETKDGQPSGGYTEYRYGRYVYTDYRLHTCWCETYMTKLFGSATLQYSDWSTSRYNPSGRPWTCGYCKGNHIGIDHYSNGIPYWNRYILPDGDYFWEESRTVGGQSQTLYRYRDWINN